MCSNKYKNIQLTTQIDEANCITHSGRFHVDDVISTIFLSKIIDSVILARVPTIRNKDIKDKIVYDIGLGKEYLKKIGVKYIDKTFEYMDKELIQNIDAADNMQFEYVENKISPDFVKLCNPRME